MGDSLYKSALTNELTLLNKLQDKLAYNIEFASTQLNIVSSLIKSVIEEANKAEDKDLRIEVLVAGIQKIYNQLENDLRNAAESYRSDKIKIDVLQDVLNQAGMAKIENEKKNESSV